MKATCTANNDKKEKNEKAANEGSCDSIVDDETLKEACTKDKDALDKGNCDDVKNESMKATCT